MGLEALRVDEFKSGKVTFPSVRVSGGIILDFMPIPDSASAEDTEDAGVEPMNHLCLVTSEAGFNELTKSLETHAIAVEQGPVTRWGAKGNGTSVYLLDPEGNRVEVRYYP
jgi:extradiol dioxygenase family protein